MLWLFVANHTWFLFIWASEIVKVIQYSNNGNKQNVNKSSSKSDISLSLKIDQPETRIHYDNLVC